MDWLALRRDGTGIGGNFFMKTLVASLAFCFAGILSGAEFQIGAHTFILPEGFTIELVANTPLVDRPIEADFDEQGRLYVTDSSGTNDKPDKQLIDRPHRVVRLEDTDKDGKFDKTITFADKMMFPEGCMWFKGSLYVSAPPSIWKLTDTNGDGVADQREEWFKGGTLTGCANDLHGPYAGPDGWIYWTKGAFAKQTHERPGQAPIVTRAAHIFRARPDGSGLEFVMTGGMDNPVGVAFSPEGERFFTSTFIQRPEAGRRDGLVHAIYGGVYGKENDVVDDHPQTGGLMPIMTHLGAAAPAGVMRYKSVNFGEGFKDNMFVCNFNMHKVTRHVLTRVGASYETKDSDFVLAADTDFHPTDVLEDADGSILIVDTGGWYKLCCPTSQLAKPDVLGAIYRVRKIGAKAAPRAPTALDEFWKLATDNSDEAREKVRAAINLRDPETRVAAMHIAALNRDAGAKDNLLMLLGMGRPHEKRVAAEALGRLKDPSTVRELMRIAGIKTIDRVLEHSLIYALIEIGKPEAIRAHQKMAPKAALIALSQIPGAITAQELAPYLAGEGEIRKTAEWIAAKHPDWGAEFAEIFRKHPDLKSIEPLLARLAGTAPIQQLLAELAPTNSLVALRAMAQSGLKKTPDAWLPAVAGLIRSKDAEIQRQAILTARGLALPKEANDVHAALQEVAGNSQAPAAVRLAALRTLPENRPLADAMFQVALENLASTAPVEVRADATATLTRAALTQEQTLVLADQLPKIGPMEFTRLFDVFEKRTDETTGLRLVAAARDSKVLASLPDEWLGQRLKKYPESVRKAVEALPHNTQGAAAQRAKLEELASAVKTGDIRRGQAIFNSAKTACVTCHSMGYAGGKVGPDLTSIGQVRTEVDLLESIIFPSASFVRSYEPVVVSTKSGDTHAGILRGDNEEGVTLVTGPNAEQKIARAEIAEMRPGNTSIMPAGLDTQLSKQDLADLVAFLKGAKWGAN